MDIRCVMISNIGNNGHGKGNGPRSIVPQKISQQKNGRKV